MPTPLVVAACGGAGIGSASVPVPVPVPNVRAGDTRFACRGRAGGVAGPLRYANDPPAIGPARDPRCALLPVVDDDELRRRLVEAGHPAVARLRPVDGGRGHPGLMSESSAEHASAEWPHRASDAVRAGGAFAPGEAWPDPLAPSGSTAWAQGTDRGRVETGDGTTPWGQPDPPAAVPPPMAGTDVGHRVGWLTAGRDDGDGPDAA